MYSHVSSIWQYIDGYRKWYDEVQSEFLLTWYSHWCIVPFPDSTAASLIKGIHSICFHLSLLVLCRLLGVVLVSTIGFIRVVALCVVASGLGAFVRYLQRLFFVLVAFCNLVSKDGAVAISLLISLEALFFCKMLANLCM